MSEPTRPEPWFGEIEPDDRDPLEVMLDDLRASRHITEAAYDQLTAAAVDQATGVVAATLWTVLEAEEQRQPAAGETAEMYRNGVLTRLHEAATNAEARLSADDETAVVG